MRFRATQYLTFFAALALSTPVWAAPKSATIEIDHPSMIGTTQLQPGEYQLRVKDDGTQASVVRGGKTIAEVPCHWIKLDKKPDQTEVLLNANKITEVDFGGDLQAAQF